MLVTRETDYAVRCVLYLARKTDQRTNVGEIALRMHIPQSYLSKILQRLVRGGIVESVRGMKGGYRLMRTASKITLLDVFNVMQGPAPINICAVDDRRCRMSSTCAVHPVWKEIRSIVEKRLKRETISRLLGEK